MNLVGQELDLKLKLVVSNEPIDPIIVVSEIKKRKISRVDSVYKKGDILQRGKKTVSNLQSWDDDDIMEEIETFDE
jgi:hypothetical protein